jgi:hypothetical protein
MTPCTRLAAALTAVAQARRVFTPVPLQAFEAGGVQVSAIANQPDVAAGHSQWLLLDGGAADNVGLTRRAPCGMGRRTWIG